MAKVRAAKVRVVYQYRDEAGHRLAPEKGAWKAILTTDILLLDCPKCPEPEPEPVECDMAEYHEAGKVGKWYRFCPQCGKRLLEA